MTYVWFDLGNGRKVRRKATPPPRGPRSDLGMPMLVRPFSEPVQSMANGKWYDNPRDLAKSHKASGNPHGVDFIELGNEELSFVEHKTDEKQLRDHIREAQADVKAGRLPDVVALED